jgi:hypothetical protein
MARPSRAFNAFGTRRLADRCADQFSAANATRVNSVFKLGGARASGVVDHTAPTDHARHHQGRQARRGKHFSNTRLISVFGEVTAAVASATVTTCPPRVQDHFCSRPRGAP